MSWLYHARNDLTRFHRAQDRPDRLRDFGLVVDACVQIFDIYEERMALIHLHIDDDLVLVAWPVEPVSFSLHCLDEQAVGIDVVPRDPLVELDLKEDSSGPQGLQTLWSVPSLWQDYLVAELWMVVGPCRLYHNACPLALSHVLNSLPEPMRKSIISKREL